MCIHHLLSNTRVPSLPPPHLNDPRDHLGPKAKKTVTMLNLLSAAALPGPGVSPIPNFALPVSRGPPWQSAPPGEDARRVVTGGWAPRAWTPLATGGGEGRPQGPPPRGKRPPSPGPSLLATPAVPDARPARATTPPAPASVFYSFNKHLLSTYCVPDTVLGTKHAMWETWVQSLDWEDPLAKEKATYSSILAWSASRLERRAESLASPRDEA